MIFLCHGEPCIQHLHFYPTWLNLALPSCPASVGFPGGKRLYPGQIFAGGFFRNRGGIAKNLVRVGAARLDPLQLLSCHKVVSRKFELTKDITRL